MRQTTLLDTHQAAAELQVSPKQVSALIRAGRLPAESTDADWAIAPEDLELVRERPTGRPRKQTSNVRGMVNKPARARRRSARARGGRPGDVQEWQRA